MNTEASPPSSRVPAPDGGFHEEIEHTADLALRCGGPDLATFFRSAAFGMYRLMTTGRLEGPQDERRSLSLEAPDIESLLVEWLGELAYLAEAKGLIFSEIDFEELSDSRLSAVLKGGRSFRLETVIKAVTYHDLEVAKTPKGYVATVVFDV